MNPARSSNEKLASQSTIAGIVAFRDPMTDETLVAAAKRGDEKAFETLVRRHRPRILALALRYTRVREDAEDVVQQALQKAFIYLNSFEGKSSFSTWITRIAINEALMWLRRARALREVSVDNLSSEDESVPALEIPDGSPDPEAEYLQREGLQILFTAIGELRPGMRTAIELRELDELSTRETARRMDLSLSTVKARVFQGRKKLRETLRRYRRSPRMSSRSALAPAGSLERRSQNRLTCNSCG
jgi:RNA polymerase sigma-70 factor (ECF subfamily)